MNAPWEKDEIIPDGGTASPWEQDDVIEPAPEAPQPGPIRAVGQYLTKPFVETGKFIGQEAKRIGENVSAPTTFGRSFEPGSTAELYAGIPERVGRVVGGVGGALARGATEAITPIIHAGMYGAKQVAKGVDAIVPGTPMRNMRDDIVQDFTPIVTKAKPFVEAGIEKYGQYKESLPESERANLEAAEGMAEFLGAFMPIRAIEKPVEQFGKQLVKDLAKKPEAAVEKAAAQFDKAAEIGTSKGIKPTVVGKPSLAKMTGFYNKVNKAAQTIAEQKDAIRILDENGEQVSHPRSSAEMAQAIDQAKKNVFKQYNDMSVAAGEGGVRLSIKPIDEKLLKITGNVPEDLQHMIPQWEKSGGVPQGIVLPDKKFNPDVRSYAARLREEIRELDGQPPEIIEARIADLNASLKNFYANPDRVGAAKAQVDASVAQALREELDNIITSVEGPGYKELKGKYGALKAIEKEVNKRALVNARRSPKGLYDLTDIFTGGEIVGGLISMNPAMIAKGVTGLGIERFYAWLKNPDRYIEKMFDRAYKLEDAKRGVRPPEPPTTPGGAPVPKSVVPDTPREAEWKAESGKMVRPPAPYREPPENQQRERNGFDNEDGFISLPGGRPNPPSPIDPGPGVGTPRPSRPAPGGGTSATIPQSDVEANRALIGRLQAEATDRARRNELDFMQREAEEINNWEKQFGNDYIWTEGLPIGEAKYVKRGTPEETWYQSRLAAIRDEEAVARQGWQDQGDFQKSRQSPRTETPAPIQRPAEPISDAGSVRQEPAAAPAAAIREPGGGGPSEPPTPGEPPRTKVVGARKISNVIDPDSYKELAEHPNSEISRAFDEALLGYEFYREIYTDPALRRAMGVDRLSGPVSREAKAHFDEQMRILSGETSGTLDPEVEKMLTAKAEAINIAANDPSNAGDRSIRLFGADGQVHADDIKGIIESAPRTYAKGNRQIISKRAFDLEMNKLRRQTDDAVEPPPREEPPMVGAEADIPIIDGEPMFSRKAEPRMDIETAKETARSNGLEYVTSTPAPGGPSYTFRDPRTGTEFKATTRSEVRQAIGDIADHIAPKGTVKAGDRVAFSRKASTPEQVAKASGLEYKGKWESGHHEFYDPETNGNITDKDLTKIPEKTTKMRESFKNNPPREAASGKEKGLQGEVTEGPGEGPAFSRKPQVDAEQYNLFGGSKTVSELEADEMKRLERNEARRRIEERKGGEAAKVQQFSEENDLAFSRNYTDNTLQRKPDGTPDNLPEKQFRPAKSSDQNAAKALAIPAGEALGRPLTPDDIRAVEPIDSEARNAAAALRKITGMPVVFVQTSDAMKAAGIDFNGVHFGGRIFLNVDNEHPYLVTGFHEAWEGIKKNHSDLVEPLIDHVMDNLTPEGRRAANLRALSETAKDTPTEADIRNAVKENLFDFGADQMSRPEWWTSLYEKSPEAVRRIVQDVIAHINKFLADLKIRKLDNTQHYRDAVEIRDRMKSIHAEVLKREFGDDGAEKIAGDMAALSKKADGVAGSKQIITPEFKKWFGDSKVVDKNGNPVKIFHGTNDNFSKINMKKGAQGIFWFSSDRGSIEKGESGAQGIKNIMELYASIKKPAGWKEYEKYGLGQLEDMGYDGAILKNKDGSFDGFVFSPTQIKSATGNRGTFDPDNPDIRFSRKTAK